MCRRIRDKHIVPKSTAPDEWSRLEAVGYLKCGGNLGELFAVLERVPGALSKYREPLVRSCGGETDRYGGQVRRRDDDDLIASCFARLASNRPRRVPRSDVHDTSRFLFLSARAAATTTSSGTFGYPLQPCGEFGRPLLRMCDDRRALDLSKNARCRGMCREGSSKTVLSNSSRD